ncbi:MAG: DUF167 domain-containing protein [Chthonomonas sp.]|nr:DUF167 domain-containing protein [Chthonomonas sp.]
MEVRVQPRSSQSKVVVDGGGLKVYTNAAPVDGEANEAVIALLSKALGVPKSAISIARGATGRKKKIIVEGLSDEQILARVTSS